MFDLRNSDSFSTIILLTYQQPGSAGHYLAVVWSLFLGCWMIDNEVNFIVPDLFPNPCSFP